MPNVEEILEWAQDAARFGPRPAVILPFQWPVDIQRAVGSMGNVYLGYVPRQMIAYPGNPLSPGEWKMLIAAKEAARDAR